MPRPFLRQKAPTASAHAGTVSHDHLGFERMLFFSDAVFAIAITLLVLEIRLPGESAELSNQELLQQLIGLFPSYLGYIISFLVIGSFWIAHHQMFRIITNYDNRLLNLNLLLLLFIAFIPFPTTVISDSGNRTATIFYALAIMAVGLCFTMIWWHALRNPQLTESWTTTQLRKRMLRSLIPPGIFLLSIGLAFLNDDLAKFSWLLLAVVGNLTHHPASPPPTADAETD